MIEIKDKNYSELDKDESFTEYCELVVKTTDENGNTTEEEKEGIQIKGKDMLYLNAPEIYFPQNAPLDTDKRELYEILNELFQDGGEGGDWQPPPWWIPVPEPQEYDIYVLIWATKTGYQNTGMDFVLFLVRESDNETGHGSVFVDWGDGTTDQYNQIGFPAHTYADEGQYLVHIIADENSNCWRSSGYNQAMWQIVKTGENIAFVTDYNNQNGYPYGNVFPSLSSLKYVQINHLRGLPINTKGGVFSSCGALQKIELKNKISGNISTSTFSTCYGFYNFDRVLNCEEITSIGNNAFYYCHGLKKIILPNCTSIGDYAFQGCYNLQEIVVADGCTFGTNCFQSCYSLYPRPDGSVN